MKIIKAVTFFGSSAAKEGEAVYTEAYDAAKAVAQSGRDVVNGGGPGTMLAASRGAKEGKGKGIVVYYTPKYATEFEGKSAENYADEVFEEANYVMRTKKLLELGNVYVVFNGGTGTLSEFGMAWGLAKLYFGHHKPVILYGSQWKEIITILMKDMMIPEHAYNVLSFVENTEELIEAINKYEMLARLHKHMDLKGEERFFTL